MAFAERQLVVVVIDLAHFVHAVRGMGAIELAGLVDRYYREVGDRLSSSGGRVVKYLGDAILAVFPPDRAREAVAAVQSLDPVVARLGADHDVRLELGANVHLSTVAEGAFGPDERYDVMGTGVNHTFRMAAGPGVRISEPVYRKLANDVRSGWEKRQPPATYWQEP
ncbi:MAG TPA: adenylate/guanylate cyclase domain-containing protein [Acidimicrobiales bacterium]|nr:adenylate/guanylate cyclase domain-containing protein [Acidimicrobiales bacterium]